MRYKEFELSVEKDGSVYIGGGGSRWLAVPSIPILCEIVEAAQKRGGQLAKPVDTPLPVEELSRRLELLSRNLSAACARIAALEVQHPPCESVTAVAHRALEARVTTVEGRLRLVQGIFDRLKLSIPAHWI